MKNHIVPILIVLVMLDLAGCLPGKESALREANLEYSQDKEYFNSSYVDHFPGRLNSLAVAMKLDTSEADDHIRFLLFQYNNKEKCDSVREVANRDAMAVYKPDDTCLLVVNRFTTIENWKIKDKSALIIPDEINRDCYRNKLPVPNFWDYPGTISTSDVKLPEDYTLYVFDAKAGNYWDKDTLTGGQYMPDGWKNGYSKGVAVSEKRNDLIFWLLFW